MEEIFIAIQERIALQMPELSLVDEDYGQLITEEDTYPVTFPCVLISTIDADWTDIGMGGQKGDCNITVKLAIDCYDDTHYGSGTADKIRERLQMNNSLYKLLQGFRISKEMGSLKRTKSTGLRQYRGERKYMKRRSASTTTIIVRLFASKQGQLGGGDPGLFDFWNRLYYDVRQLPAILPDNRHDPFF